MNNIEIIVCLILLFMAVPDACRLLGRTALIFSAFVIFGLLLEPFTAPQVGIMLQQAGQIGFLLLLFEVGLEIDLPRFHEFKSPLRFAATWGLVQLVLAFILSIFAGLDWLHSILAATALSACSVGMAYPAWKTYPGLSAELKPFLLHVMIALEVMAIIFLAAGSTVQKSGITWWILVKLGGIALTIFLIARFGDHLKTVFQAVLERATHWRIHWLVLLVLAICAIGQRLGLDAPKTAFFLGLAMSRTLHNGQSLEEYIAPISQRFLIPVFFVSLGMQIDWRLLFDWTALYALMTATMLIGAREVVSRRWLKTGGDARSFLLLCPNLTIVALAAKGMLDHGTDSKLVGWLVLTGLFMTIPSLLLLPGNVSASKEPK